MLELGTWYGGGSSLCIARGLKASNDAGGDKVLVTVEPFEPAHTYARATLLGFPVRLILGTTLPASELPSADAVAADGGVPDVPRAQWETWLAEDRVNMAAFAAPQLPTLCRDFAFDFVLIDAGEFMGNAEWAVVRDACKPAYVGLHDTNTFKTRRVLAELLAQPAAWELVARGDPPQEKAGWAIFKRLEG